MTQGGFAMATDTAMVRHARMLAVAVALVLATAGTQAAQRTTTAAPAQGAPGASSDVAEAPPALKPGQFDWHPERAGPGPVLIVVSLDDQLAHVYRNGVRIATTTVSSGSRGRETPTGVYTILQKELLHHSNLYDDAPMPYMQRLTWDGVALHAGRIPGYPASHGCIRLPAAFAEKLYHVTYRGGTVVVMDAASLATLDLAGVPADMARLVFDGTWRETALPGASWADADTGGLPSAVGGGGRARAD
jgi:hypothetical protein